VIAQDKVFEPFTNSRDERADCFHEPAEFNALGGFSEIVPFTKLHSKWRTGGRTRQRPLTQVNRCGLLASLRSDGVRHHRNNEHRILD